MIVTCSLCHEILLPDSGAGSLDLLPAPQQIGAYLQCADAMGHHLAERHPEVIAVLSQLATQYYQLIVAKFAELSLDSPALAAIEERARAVCFATLAGEISISAKPIRPPSPLAI